MYSNGIAFQFCTVTGVYRKGKVRLGGQFWGCIMMASVDPPEAESDAKPALSLYVHACQNGAHLACTFGWGADPVRSSDLLASPKLNESQLHQPSDNGDVDYNPAKNSSLKRLAMRQNMRHETRQSLQRWMCQNFSSH